MKKEYLRKFNDFQKSHEVFVQNGRNLPPLFIENCQLFRCFSNQEMKKEYF